MGERTSRTFLAAKIIMSRALNRLAKLSASKIGPNEKWAPGTYVALFGLVCLSGIGFNAACAIMIFANAPRPRPLREDIESNPTENRGTVVDLKQEAGAPSMETGVLKVGSAA